MHTKILHISQKAPERGKIKVAADAIRRGGLVIFPTETIYGIGANALDVKACTKIFAVKGRPSENPLIVTVCSMKMAREVAEIPKRYEKIIARIWPGPITLVMKSTGRVPDMVISGLDTVAVRMPAHRVALEMIKEAGVPVAGPSANLSKRPSSTAASHVIEDFKDKVDVIIDSGTSRYGLESTILDLSTFTILRPGAFTVEDLAEIFGRKPRVPSYARGTSEAAIARSPGMKYKHYAPLTPLFLFDGDPKRLSEILHGMMFKIGFIGSDESCSSVKGTARVIRLGSREDAPEVARHLFDGLRRVDRLGVDFAIAEKFDECGLGLAIMNRLRKASGHKEFKNRGQLMRLLPR